MIVVSPKAPAKQKAHTIFDSEYAKLNAQQKQAVDTIEGPLMVVAGPGTGKTQVVAMRVANILKKTQMRPNNILCLTFSISGSTAMRERLRLLIGADAYGVTVSTIHAFAQSIIEQNAAVFEEWAAKQQISDVEKIREMHTIIDQNIQQMELLNPKDPYGRIPDILGRISQVKREGKSMEDLERVAKEYDEQMQTKSKPGTKIHEKNLAAAQKFRDFIKLYDAYQMMLRNSGRYDYDDMILTVTAALREEDWLLSNIQERYQYVIVDEFQDTNGSQYDFIELLTSYKDVPNEPNVCVVGDDDQAIYRFQGANRLGGNSLMETLVFGRIAGQSALNYINNKSFEKIDEKILKAETERISKWMNNNNAPSPREVRLKMGKIMDEKVGPFRDENMLCEALEAINKLIEEGMRVSENSKVFNSELQIAYENYFMLRLAQCTIISAIERKESRGAHTRTDYPKRDDKNFLTHMLCTISNNGPKVSHRPVKITKYEPKERKY